MATKPHRAKPRRPQSSGVRTVALIVAAYPNRAAATRSARSLVRAGTLACATVDSAATAFYRWEGRFHEESSVVLWGRCAWRRRRGAVDALRAIHPDRVPDILAIQVDAADPGYAAWVVGEGAAPRQPSKVPGPVKRRARR